jgi:hypothetical protein
MRSNARTVRLSGTAFSRSLEMQQDLASFLSDYPDATEIPLDWVLDFVDKVLGTTRGTLSTRRPCCGWQCPTTLKRP